MSRKIRLEFSKPTIAKAGTLGYIVVIPQVLHDQAAKLHGRKVTVKIEEAGDK